MFVVLVFQILLCFTSGVTAQPVFISRVCQDTFGNYTSNSIFKKNLNKILSSITSNTQIDYGFYNFSAGQGFDRVHGIGLCRPDISVADCRHCLKNGAAELVLQCPNQKDAIGWYDECMIRYTDRYIFSKLEFGPWYKINTTLFGVHKGRFNQTMSTLLARLQKKAASGDSRYKFAADEANITQDSLTMRALVQCTPDLEEYDCYKCLDDAINMSLNSFYGEQARVFFTSCNIRYESYSFYNATRLTSLELPNLPPSLASLPPSFAKNAKGNRSKKLRIVIITIPLAASLALLATLFGYCYLRRERRISTSKKVQAGDEIRTPDTLQMDFSTIKAATGNFSDANKLGRGGFGTVYKGTLPSGQAIAVKRLSENSGQGEEEFKNEAVLVARLQHRNMVRFMGFCLEEEERLLIYELLPNQSLDNFLFDPSKRVHLNWQTRYKIIEGIVRGLVYLHEDSRLLVVHRDLKPSNILLDEEMNPKISDFGMARLFGADQTQGATNKICGTYGYMPPEYVLHGLFSIKSDVFSFGVLLLEIISGVRINIFYNEETGESLLSFDNQKTPNPSTSKTEPEVSMGCCCIIEFSESFWKKSHFLTAWRNWLEGTAFNLVDSSMLIFNTKEVLRCINIGLLCIQENIAHRPIMSSIVLMLNSSNTALPVPSRPAFSIDNHVQSDQNTQAQDISKNDISISELDPR